MKWSGASEVGHGVGLAHLHLSVTGWGQMTYLVHSNVPCGLISARAPSSRRTCVQTGYTVIPAFPAQEHTPTGSKLEWRQARSGSDMLSQIAPLFSLHHCSFSRKELRSGKRTGAFRVMEEAWQ